MKKFRNAIAYSFLFSAACIPTACDIDNPPVPVPEANSGTLLDAKHVALGSLVIDDVQERFLVEGEYANSYWAKQKDTAPHSPLDYENMRLYVYRDYDGAAQPESTAEQRREYYQFGDRVIKDLLAVSEAPDKAYVPAPHFLMAQLNGRVSITADVALFGLEAGTDLSSHFRVKGPNAMIPQGSVQQHSIRYDFGTEQPTSVADFYSEGTWLQERYIFWLADIPEERYEEVRFTVTIPVRCELWQDYFYEGGTEVATENRTLSTEVTLKMGSTVELTDMLRDVRQRWE